MVKQVFGSHDPVKRAFMKHNFADHLTDTGRRAKLHHNDELIIEIDSINKLVYDINVAGKSEGALMDTTNIFNSLLQKTTTSTTTSASTEATKEDSSLTFQEVLPLIDRTNLIWDVEMEKSLQKNAIVKGDKLEIEKFHTRFKNSQIQIQNNFRNIDLFKKKLSSFFEFGKIVPIIIGSECCSQNKIKDNIVLDFERRGADPSINSLVDIVKHIQIYPTAWVDSIETLKKNIIKTKNKMISISDDFIKKHQTNSLLIDEISSIEDDYFTTLNDQIESDIPKISKDSVSTAVSFLTGLLNQANNSKNFKFVGRYPATGNYLNVDIKAIPKSTFKTLLAADSTSYRIPVRYRFEWAIGPALNFGFGECNFDRSYNVDSARNGMGAVKPDTFFINRNTRQSQVSPSVGLMANFYWQTHCFINPGLSLGISTTPNDLSQLKAYLGACMLIGQLSKNDKNSTVYNRIIFSAGLSYNRVDRLKGSLIEGENPKSRMPFTGNNIATDQLTEKVGLIGFYFGFSYKIN